MKLCELRDAIVAVIPGTVDPDNVDLKIPNGFGDPADIQSVEWSGDQTQNFVVLWEGK